jgi:peptide/nickel transport system substrate-binding protein
MRKSRFYSASIAVIAAGAVALSGVILPSTANTKDSVVTIENNGFTSLNSGVRNYNLATNNYVNYLTGQSWFYFDDKLKLVKNPTFGSFRISKDTATDFRTEWKLANGLVWNDGTPITAEDMLMSHIVNSNQYSIDKGLGNPASGATVFNSGTYSGIWSNAIAGDPVIGKDNLTVTLNWKYPIPDWELFGPGTFPVHALVLLAEGKTSLGTAAENTAAKKRFLDAFKGNNPDLLKKMGDVWSKDYITKSVSRTTNPLLLVRNGAYNIQEIVSDQSITLVQNPRYNTGPKPKIKTIIIKIVSGAAAPQAIANKEADIFSGQATVDSIRQFQRLNGVGTVIYPQGVYEHVDLRVARQGATGAQYTGPFAVTGDKAADDKARDLRRAMLLSVPRKEIETKLVRRINPRGVLMNSNWTLTTDSLNAQVVANNGSKVWGGTDEARRAQALALVKKHFPNASETNPAFTVRMNWGNPADNPRRVAQAQLIVASAAKVGINVINDGKAAWSSNLGNIANDLSFFAWQKTSPSPLGSLGIFRTGGGSNFSGWSDKQIDDGIAALERKTTPAQKVKIYQQIDKALNREAFTLPLFQHTAVVAYNSALKNVKPSPISPIIYWNFWEWTY